MANNGNTEDGVLQVDEMGKVPRAKKELKDQIEFHCCALGAAEGQRKNLVVGSCIVWHMQIGEILICMLIFS